MRFVNKELFKSLRFRIGLAFFAICLPLMMLLIYYNRYAGEVVRDQVAQSNKNLVSLYMGQIDRTLEEVDEYLFKTAAQETDLLLLDRPNSFYTTVYQLAKIRLANKISVDIKNYKASDMFFVYSKSNDDFFIGLNDLITFEQKEQARTAIIGMLNHEQELPRCTQEWCVRRIGQDYFLSHIVRMGNVFIGAWVNVSRLMVPMNLIDLRETGISLLAAGGSEPMDHAEIIQSNGIDLSLGNELYKITGNNQAFLEVGERSSKGDFSLIVLLPEKGIMEKLPIFQKIISFVPIGFVFILLMLLLFLRKLILRPIYRMLAAMRKIKEGNWDAQIPPYPTSGEFEVMHATFNEMVSQIQKLKIDVYEEQLNHQRAELQHLQLQINPHFFLNSLNIVYHLAQSRKFELIQEMSLSLVEYFRYMFRSNLSFVRLNDEIRHTCNYLNIQMMRFPDHLTYRVEGTEHHGDVMVPPLVVQTFVENTIKHAVTMDEPVHIAIAVDKESSGEEEFLCISIRDTGKGFPEEVLQRLRTEQAGINESGHHIGIWNLKRRLALLYRQRANIEFSNGPEGGAEVYIVLPVMISSSKIDMQ
ncbi:sensor histidine kinase [Paenibacillus hamazuiensis]|uniref:sensor histidine kinase n=1 Tax=Paenibacillus hamazuiensis TaxID=2936508 RepID=UPI00200D35E6|nr:histidine kinase [Paenibacillus hamazuiensis]